MVISTKEFLIPVVKVLKLGSTHIVLIESYVLTHILLATRLVHLPVRAHQVFGVVARDCLFLSISMIFTTVLI